MENLWGLLLIFAKLFLFIFMEINQKEINERLIETVKAVAYNARRIRMESGYDEKQLAGMLQMSIQRLRRLENAKREKWYGRPEKIVCIPLLQTLNKFSVVCNVCITEFFKPVPCQ